jgi:hypothetical protein
MSVLGQVTTRTPYYAQRMVLQKIVTHRAQKVPPLYPQFMREIENDPKRSFMDIGSYAELGLFQQKNEGAPFAQDQPFELIPSHFEFTTYGLGASVTREAQYEDPLDLMGKLAPMLADSWIVSADVMYNNVWNQAFSPVQTLYDGQPLCSANHLLSAVPGDLGPISKIGATFSNLIGSAQPSPEVLRQMELIFELTRSDRNLPSQRTAEMLMCHPNYAKTWQEIVGTPYAPNSNQNTVNTEYDVIRVKANQYLTNTSAYFLLGAPTFPDGAGNWVITSHKWQNDVWIWYEDQTRAWYISSEARSTFGAADFRGVVGGPGAGP